MLSVRRWILTIGNAVSIAIPPRVVPVVTIWRRIKTVWNPIAIRVSIRIIPCIAIRGVILAIGNAIAVFIPIRIETIAVGSGVFAEAARWRRLAGWSSWGIKSVANHHDAESRPSNHGVAGCVPREACDKNANILKKSRLTANLLVAVASVLVDTFIITNPCLPSINCVFAP